MTKTADRAPEFFDTAVAGGRLRAARWGDGPQVVLGIHGITASSVSWRPVARHLGAEFTLLAPDLRGRGGSADLPEPFGMSAHAEDCARLLDSGGAGPVVVAGQSMGGFVAVMLAAQRPDLVAHLVLIDGGLPLPIPDGVDPDQLLDALLGPAIARLRQEFASEDAYLDFWRAHPSLSRDWSSDLEDYARYDLTGTPPHLRSKVSEAAVRADSADMFLNAGQFETALAALRVPICLLRAPRNLLNQPVPLIPEEVVRVWADRLPQLQAELVDDTNHYTIAFGQRGAGVVAERIRQAARPLAP